MKKIATKFSVIALIAVALTSCNKKNNPPEADKEFNSAVEASIATYIATDIDQMVALGSEYSSLQFYSTASVVPNPLSRDTTNKINTVTYVNCIGADGIYRNGVITINYVGTTASTAYIRNPGHVSNVTFNNVKIGKYAVDNSSTLKVTNTTAAGYTRSLTPLTWKVEASLILKDTTDNQQIKWTGTLNKTLANSTTYSIHPSTSLPIVWTFTNNALNSSGLNAIVNYVGDATGTTKNGASFTYTISTDNPIVRNFGCSPDYYINPEQHPFNNGKAVFKTGDKSVRFIYYGDEKGGSTCDNSTVIMIEGVSYLVDMKYQ